MWKRAVLLLLCFVLLCTPIAQAAEAREAGVVPMLTFSGRTAYCDCTVTAYEKSIFVRMELWYGSTLVDSWTQSGTSTVSLNKTCTVNRGRTYTLKVSGTIGGVSFGPTSVTQKCPLF